MGISGFVTPASVLINRRTPKKIIWVGLLNFWLVFLLTVDLCCLGYIGWVSGLVLFCLQWRIGLVFFAYGPAHPDIGWSSLLTVPPLQVRKTNRK